MPVDLWYQIPEDLRIVIYARVFLYKLRDFCMPARKLKKRLVIGCCLMQMSIDNCDHIRPLDVWWACERLRISLCPERDKIIFKHIHPEQHVMDLKRALLNFLERIHYYSGPDSPYQGRVWTCRLQQVWYQDILPYVSDLFRII